MARPVVGWTTTPLLVTHRRQTGDIFSDTRVDLQLCTNKRHTACAKTKACRCDDPGDKKRLFAECRQVTISDYGIVMKKAKGGKNA